MKCPRCGSEEFWDYDCGPDSYEDDIAYTSYKCKKCGLWYDGWRDRWLEDCENCGDEEEAEEYKG